MTLSASFLKARNFLRTLQRAPEPTRRKWQRGVSTIAMVLVVVGWVVYLNLSLSPAAPPKVEVPGENDFWETLGKGFDVLGSTISEEWAKVQEKSGSFWGGLGAELTNPSVFTFVREETPFTPSAYEPVAPQTLPVENQ